MALERRDKKIEILEKKLTDQRKEMARLTNVIHQQQDDMKILCQTGDDLFVMAQQLRQADKHLDEMEMASNATEPNVRQLKKLIELID